jgi:hypothetical protein
MEKYAAMLRELDPQEAEPLLEQVLEQRLKVHGESHVLSAEAMSNLADLYRQLGRFDEAVPLLERALAVRKVRQADHQVTRETERALAIVYFKVGRRDDAVAIVTGSVKVEGGETDVRLDDCLVGYWTFEEGAGETVSDQSGNELTGKLLAADAGSYWSKDIPPTANNRFALLLGGSGEHVEVPDSDSLDTGSSYTIAAWVKTDATPKSWERIVDKGIFAGGYAMLLNNATGHILFQVAEEPATVGKHVVGGDKVNDGAWHHVTCIFDDKLMKLYMDGGLAKLVQVPEAEPRNNDSPLRFGHDEPNEADSFRGLIDEVRIYRRALNPVEVVSLAWPKLPPKSDGAQ